MTDDALTETGARLHAAAELRLMLRSAEGYEIFTARARAVLEVAAYLLEKDIRFRKREEPQMDTDKKL